MFRDEVAIQYPLGRARPFDDGLHDAFERCRVPTDFDLIIVRRDRGRTEGDHLERVLRIGEALQRPLLQRVEYNDRHTATGALIECAHHAGMIGAWIVAHRNDQFTMIEVFQRHRALADADCPRQANTGRLVAHIGAIGEIVGAIFAREDIEKEGGFVGSAAGCIELRHVGVRQFAQHLADHGERGIPVDRFVGVAGPVIGHRVGEAAVVF